MFNINFLEDKNCFKIFEIIRVCEIGLKVLLKVCCLYKFMKCFVWLGVNIKCFDDKGKVLGIYVLKLENYFFIDIIVMLDNYLVYSDNCEWSINKMKNIEDNRIERVIILNGWKLLVVCCSFKDELFVIM